MNHAERPLFVMKVAVTAAIITIVTAPGQNCRSIGLGPTVAKQYKHRCNEQRDLGCASERDAYAHIQAVLARGRKCHGHFSRGADQGYDDEPDECRAHPQRRRRCCTNSTKISLTNATNTVITSRVPTARLIGHFVFSRLAVILARKEFLVRL